VVGGNVLDSLRAGAPWFLLGKATKQAQFCLRVSRVGSSDTLGSDACCVLDLRVLAHYVLGKGQNLNVSN
jgi:hypothetical protein